MFWQLLIILKLIGIYDLPFEYGRTLIILEVRGRLWCLFSAYDRSARKPRKKNKNSEIAKKKFGSRRFWRVGRSTANWQNFKDGLSFCHFFDIVNLVIFHPDYIDRGYFLWAQLLLQFCTNCFETLHVFSSWYEDVHVNWT